MMTRRSILTALSLAPILASCGGGTKRLAQYGDSLSATVPELQPGPAQEISELLGWDYLDFAVGGDSVRNHTRVAPGCDLYLIRFAGADALHWGTLEPDAVEVFKQHLVRLIKTAPAQVVLTGSITLAPFDELANKYPELANYPLDVYHRKVEDVRLYTEAVGEVATQLQLPWIDLRRVPFGGVSDLRDIVHPNQAYSTRISQYVASELQKVI